MRELGLCATEALMLEAFARGVGGAAAERGPAALQERRFRPHLWATARPWCAARGRRRGAFVERRLALPLSVAFGAGWRATRWCLPSPRASGVVVAGLRAVGALRGGLGGPYGPARGRCALTDAGPDLTVFLGAAAGRRVR
ncbi:MAG: hypothetical protein R3A52_28745 [Polyangiales bacterium]